MLAPIIETSATSLREACVLGIISSVYKPNCAVSTLPNGSHYPLFAKMVGGSGGSPFRDDISASGRLSKISIYCGDYINGLQSVYEKGVSIQHGSTRGSQFYFELYPGDSLASVETSKLTGLPR